MDTYSFLREIGDSWMLLAMFVFFVSVVVWAFMPSQKKARDEARMIPFKDEKTCDGSCENCATKMLMVQFEDHKHD